MVTGVSTAFSDIKEDVKSSRKEMYDKHECPQDSKQGSVEEIEEGQRGCQRWGDLMPTLNICEFLEVGNREMGVWSKLCSVGDHTVLLARWSHEEPLRLITEVLMMITGLCSARNITLTLQKLPHPSYHPPRAQPICGRIQRTSYIFNPHCQLLLLLFPKVSILIKIKL